MAAPDADGLVSSLENLAINKQPAAPVPRVMVKFSVNSWNNYSVGTIDSVKHADSFVEWYTNQAPYTVQALSTHIHVDEVGFAKEDKLFFIILSGVGIDDPENFDFDILCDMMVDPDDDGNYPIIYNLKQDKIVCVNINDPKFKVVYDKDSKVALYRNLTTEIINWKKPKAIHGETCLVAGTVTDIIRL